MTAHCEQFHLGIDVGSTTTKATVLDPRDNSVVFSQYKRHNARQTQSVCDLLSTIDSQLPDHRFRIAICGSGGKTIAGRMGAHYVQEVVANSIALKRQYPGTRTAIELGGQDAKIVFFKHDESTDQISVSDMRMNGSCAGGTGAFVDEIAALLKVPVEQFNDLAARGKTVHSISGRCGVYAKTDIQPLLNQGVSKEDIALSTFHAIVKQTIGGLAQGLEIKAPVAFEGGPLTFNPVLIRVFCERLALLERDTIVPADPEKIVSLGAAYSLDELFAGEHDDFALADVVHLLQAEASSSEANNEPSFTPFFTSADERDAFTERQAPPPAPARDLQRGDHVRVYLGIDSGSTTTKIALLDENEELFEEFYAPNEGDPLTVARRALLDISKKYQAQGVTLDITAVGTTGYGELLLHKALNADYHVVETVAHAEAAKKYIPDASFILDIGGQDMKAMTLDQGVVTGIIVNEACSSGCGSFLENFARSLDIPVADIAEAAFRSNDHADLGSRCTVFMNSCIVTEQKNGKSPDDIMAGLCRSIIENVFTKVVRVSNFDTLGTRIVAQGGTFKNDAVLRAFEQYLGADVTRAPYPGIMGAIGAAVLAKRNNPSTHSSFIGFDQLESLYYNTESNMLCPFCANHCNRSIVSFSNGMKWVSGNRCHRGEVTGDPKDADTRASLKQIEADTKKVPNLYEVRDKLLFCDRPYTQVDRDKNLIIGLPRVLEFWDSMPFWKTLFQSLGFKVEVSQPSTREVYESGIPFVTSDTVCFPAKLVHGHLRDLANKQVDRIFMPSITSKESENTEKTSISVCAVVKGYPIVVQNSDNPEKRWGIPFDNPLWHWYSTRDRDQQISDWFAEAFGIDPAITQRAIAQGDEAQHAFRTELQAEGAAVIEQVEREDTYAVVLAARPYQGDSLVNHDLPSFFLNKGIPVLTADSIPGANEVDLTHSRLEIVNGFHARMLSSSLIAAANPHLEYVQVVSFGCGHDALLSDEITRLMKLTSDKIPLVLKVDESDIQGPLRIRVESFIETVNTRRGSGEKGSPDHKPVLSGLETPSPQNHDRPEAHVGNTLPDPYPVKYRKRDRRDRVILVPNVSRAFCRLMTAAIAKQGVRAEPLPLGGKDAIRLGKKYVHNDICFPAQMTIGEALAALESGLYDPDEVAMGTGKLIGDCRLTHYASLLRKALDDAGYAQVPIITNDGVDQRDLHPGYRMSIGTQIRFATGLPMIDAFEQLVRKIRPYELNPGETNRVFDEAIDLLATSLEADGVRGMNRAFKQGISAFRNIAYDRSCERTPVLIIGEYLLNFHPGANGDIESYLEKNGMEVVEPQMTDVYHKGYFYQLSQIREYDVTRPLADKIELNAAHALFEAAHSHADKIASAHPLYEPPLRLSQVTKASDSIMHHTFDSGEGFLIPAEILHHAERGVRAFAILQPFGCLPNHICGRGVGARLKELYPDAQILALDYDPDVSFANVENRLQMLVMNARTREAETPIAQGDALYQEQAQDISSTASTVEAYAAKLHDLGEDIIPSIVSLSDEAAHTLLHSNKQQTDPTR